MRTTPRIVGGVLLGVFLAAWVITCSGCGGGGGAQQGTADTTSLTENRVKLIAAQAKMQQALVDMAELAIDRSGGGQIDTGIVLSEADTRLAIGFMNTYMKESARALVLADEMLDIVSQVPPSAVSTTSTAWTLDPFTEWAQNILKKMYEVAVDHALSICQATSDVARANASTTSDYSALLAQENVDHKVACDNYLRTVRAEVQATIEGCVRSALPEELSGVFQVWEKVDQVTGFVERLDKICVAVTGKHLRPTVDSGQTETIMVRAPDGAGGLALENTLPSIWPPDRIKCFWSPDATDTELPIPSAGEAMQNVVYLANEDVDVLPMEAQKVPSVPPDVLLASLWQTAFDTLRRGAIIARDMGVDSVISISADNVEMRPRLLDALAIQANLTDGGGYWPWTSTLGDLTAVTPTLYSTDFGVDQSHTYQVAAQGGYELNIAPPSPPPGPQPPPPNGGTTYTGNLSFTHKDQTMCCHWQKDVSVTITVTIASGSGTVADPYLGAVECTGSATIALVWQGDKWPCLSAYCHPGTGGTVAVRSTEGVLAMPPPPSWGVYNGNAEGTLGSGTFRMALLRGSFVGDSLVVYAEFHATVPGEGGEFPYRGGAGAITLSRSD